MNGTQMQWLRDAIAEVQKRRDERGDDGSAESKGKPTRSIKTAPNIPF